MTTKSALSALGAPISPACAHGSPRVDDLALPKSVEPDDLSLSKAVIRRMSDKMSFSDPEFRILTSRCRVTPHNDDSVLQHAISEGNLGQIEACIWRISV
jgi:hypothetical protein